MPGHPPMCSVFVVSQLCPMTLPAQRHRLRKLDRSPIRQSQRGIAFVGVVTAHACQRTMLRVQSGMKLIQIGSLSGVSIGRTNGVAGRALNLDRFSGW